MIELFKLQRPDSALAFKREQFFVRYRQDGKEVFHKLNTQDRRVARKMRDEIYGLLIKNGAKVMDLGRGRPARVPPSMTKDMIPECVYYRLPWQVRIDGKIIGNYKTIEDATAARNKYQKNKLAELQHK